MGRTMLQDMVEHTEQLPIVGELSSPLIAQILEFQESELFSEATVLQNNSEASNCTTTTNTNINTNNNNDLHTTNYSLLFDSTQDNDQNDMPGLSLEDFNDNTTDYYTVSNYLLDNNHQQNLQFADYSTTLSNNNIPNNLVTDDDVSLFRYPNDLPLAPLHIGLNNEEECLSGMPSNYTRLSTTTTTTSTTDSTAIGPYLPDTTLVDYNPAGGGGGYFFLGTDLLPQELDFLQQVREDSGGGLILGSHSLQNFYNFTTDQLQPINNSESQQLVNGVVANSTCLTPDQISGLEDPSFKVGKLTAEERREKIHRYMKKRNERNFTKKLKYACRKTLADSRPRVRGRFAKNDELEMHRITGNISSNHEEDTDEDVIVKDEDDMMDSSSDILAHIGGVDFFKCNNPLQSWI